MNAELVLRFALDAPTFAPFDASEAMAAVDLTRATVLGVCNDLADAGWLETVTGTDPDGTPRRGRPALRYRLRPDAGVVTGLDAAEDHFTVVVADLHGRVLAQQKQPVPGRSLDGDGRVDLARRMIETALASASLTARSNLVTTVAVAAPVDEHGHSPVGSGRYWPIMNPGYVTRLDGIVTVENDANLAALAEHARGREDNVATLLVDERLGTGLVVDGHLLRGHRGGAGEVRFLQAMVAPGTTAGEATTTGLSRMTVSWARESLARDDRPSSLRGAEDSLTATQVLAAAQSGDPIATEVAEKVGERLAQVALVLESVLDVQKVVLAGTIAPFTSPIIERARTRLESRYEPPFPTLVASDAGPEVVALGAVEGALRHIRRDPLTFAPVQSGS
jgi:predicted NBD/HSP70 family sugar kinase